MFTTQERALFEQLLAAGYVDCLRELYPEENGIYSWWPYAFSARSRNLGWRLDYILVPSDLRNRIIDIKHKADYLGSDHCPVELNVSAELNNCKSYEWHTNIGAERLITLSRAGRKIISLR
jgi:exodeoxyribonuclease-3